MGDNNYLHHHHQHQQQQQQQTAASSSTRMALRNAGAGEIVEVQGGHIVRSTGRKDRHSKVCTAKGPRDRRVRLSAHTAIQFYDVQDRLGYDRPSKAVDWLMKKAKPAIDELAELPAWKPTATTVIKSPKEEQGGGTDQGNGATEGAEMDDDDGARGGGGGFSVGGQDHHHHHQNHHQICTNVDGSSGLLPQSLVSDSIADTIKSFFPTRGAAAAVQNEVAKSPSSPPPPPTQQIQFAGYPPPTEFMSGGGRSHSQDLRLSLQSFRDPMILQQNHHHYHHPVVVAAVQQQQQHPFFPGAAVAGSENLTNFGNQHHGHHHHQVSAGWAGNQPEEMTRCQRLVTGWNAVDSIPAGDAGGNGSGSGGFMFSPPHASTSPLLQPFFGQLLSQREPLQSSNNNNNTNALFRAWVSDPSSITNATTDHHNHQQQMSSMHPHSMAAIGFASGGFSGFHIPARIQGDEEHDGNPNKLSSASSTSRH